MNSRAQHYYNGIQNPARHRGAKHPKQGGPFAIFAALAALLAIVGLSSCAGLTSAGTPGGGTPGTVGAGILTGSATTLTFGNISVGSNATQTLTFTNTGTGTVNISSAAITGAGFAAVAGSPLSAIFVGQSGTIQIQFAPPAAGAVAGTLTIVSDAANSPLTISLTGTGTQPGFTISPAALNFGNLPVGQSSTQAVQLTNSGNVNVVVNLATISGSGFTLSGLALPATLTAGQTLSFNVQFAPTTGGGVAGSIVFTDNAPGSPQILLLSGAGVAASQTLIATPGSFAFGSAVLGSTNSQTITLSNSGTTSVTVSQAAVTGAGFAITGLAAPTTIQAGQTTTFTAQFVPTAAGNVTGTITISSNASNPSLTIALTGIGTQGRLSSTPASIVFGTLLSGANESVAVAVTNTGTASVVISSASASGAGFSISGLATPVTLTVGQVASFTAKFAPTTVGNASGSISIASNAASSPLTIALSGSATQPPPPQLTISPTSVNFHNVVTGTSNSQPIRLTNGGSGSLTITQANVTGAGFSTTGLTLPKTVAAGGNTTFNLVFAPTTAGSRSGSVSLVSNAPNSPQAIPLTGTGTTSTSLLGASPSSLSFGNVNVGSNSALTTTLTNSGNSTITISSVTVTGAGFSGTGVTSGLMLTPNQTAVLTVTFAPTTAGTVNGTVSIASNATGSPTTVSLTGIGFSLSPHSVTLTWNASTSSGVVGYFVYRGTAMGGPYTKQNSSSDTILTYTDSALGSGLTYFYVTTAVDGNSVESSFSPEVSAVIP
jgi:hypothetical protein